MLIKTKDITIKELLTKKEYEIPSFQRNYSWESIHTQEFLHDIIKYLQPDYTTKTVKTDRYFLGTMVFVGGIDNESATQSVIDGQQRLTTITIILSVISKMFNDLKMDALSDATYNFIVFKDDFGKEKKVLKTESSFPYFTELVQMKTTTKTPITEEEETIEKTYKYYSDVLSEEKIYKEIKKVINDSRIEDIPYDEWLLQIRGQILDSIVISINTNEEDQANAIFEILNGKGKKLSSVDLIKNKIFEEIGNTLNDEAKEKWQTINKTLTSKNKKEKMDTFFRHYWAMKYKKVGEKALYDDFQQKVIRARKNPVSPSELLDDLVKQSLIYTEIMNPNLSDWKNKIEYNFLIQSMKSFEEVFKVVSARIALLALINAKRNELIDHKKFKEAILFLEDFYMIFFSFLSKRASKIEKPISDFSIALSKCSNKADAHKVIQEKLIDKLSALIEELDMLTVEQQFTSLFYKKGNHSTNVLPKLILRKINCFYRKSSDYTNDSSVEHIMNEDDTKDFSLNIGNLILLEQTLNTEAGSKDFADKLDSYRKSKYDEVLEFVSKHSEWDEDDITQRATEMYELFVTEIIHPNLRF